MKTVALLAKDRMTKKERMEALIRRKPIDRVPFYPFATGLNAKLLGVDRGTFYRNPELAFKAGLKLIELFPWMDARPSYGWADRGAWEFGGNIVWPNGNTYAAPHSGAPLITDPDEIDFLPDPDPKSAGMNALVDRFNEISRMHGFPASVPGGTPTNYTAGILGRTNFYRWLILYPEAIHRLQRKATDFVIGSVAFTIEKYGAQNCRFQLSLPLESNDLMSPQFFETFSKPYILEVVEFCVSKKLKNMTVHLCGDHTLNLPHILEIGFPERTVFSIGSRMDLEETGKLLGEEYILAGNIDTALLAQGSFEEVYAETKRCLSAGMKHRGGFILMPACELPPETPLENIKAVEQAICDHGFY